MTKFTICNQNSICSICVSDSAPATAITAAGELVRLLTVYSGRTTNICHGIPKSGDICLGAKSSNCEVDELNIEVTDDILWIDGGKRGIIYGVYELLE